MFFPCFQNNSHGFLARISIIFTVFREQLPGCFQPFVTVSNVKYNGRGRISNFYRIISMLFPCFQNNFHGFLAVISINFTAFREQLPGCFQSFVTISNVKYNGRARIPNFYRIISMLFPCFQNNFHRFLKGISIDFTAFREQLPGCLQSFITISNVKYNGRARISKEFPDCFHVFGTISMDLWK